MKTVMTIIFASLCIAMSLSLHAAQKPTEEPSFWDKAKAMFTPKTEEEKKQEAIQARKAKEQRKHREFVKMTTMTLTGNSPLGRATIH